MVVPLLDVEVVVTVELLPLDVVTVVVVPPLLLVVCTTPVMGPPVLDTLAQAAGAAVVSASTRLVTTESASAGARVRTVLSLLSRLESARICPPLRERKPLQIRRAAPPGRAGRGPHFRQGIGTAQGQFMSERLLPRGLREAEAADNRGGILAVGVDVACATKVVHYDASNAFAGRHSRVRESINLGGGRHY